MLDNTNKNTNQLPQSDVNSLSLGDKRQKEKAIIDAVYEDEKKRNNSISSTLLEEDVRRAQELNQKTLEDPELVQKVYAGSVEEAGKVVKLFNYTVHVPYGDKNLGYSESLIFNYNLKKEQIWNEEIGDFDPPKFFIKEGGQYNPADKQQMMSIHDNLTRSLEDMPFFLNNVNQFAVTYPDFVKYYLELVTLFEEFKIEKEKDDKQFDFIEYIPQFSFDSMLSDLKTYIDALEKFLYSSFNKMITMSHHTVKTKKGTEITLPYYYFFSDKFNRQEVRQRVQDSVLMFSVIPKIRFLNKNIQVTTNPDSLYIEINDFPEIIFAFVPTFQDEKEFHRDSFSGEELPSYVTVYRPFLYGDYSPVLEALQLPYVRYLVGNYYKYKKYREKHRKITWRDFLSLFIRPPIQYSYIQERGGYTYQSTVSILKTPNDVKKERIEAEKERKKRLQPNKTENIDTGVIAKIEKKLKNLDPEEVQKVVKRFNLDNLAKLAIRCAMEHVNLPDVNIPPIYLPKFNYTYDIKVQDPSGGMFKKIYEDIRTLSFKTVVDQMKKFFSVEDCDDFKRFAKKQSWENFFSRLKHGLIKDFELYVEKIKNDLLELDAILAKSLCDPEVFVISLYTADVCLTPPETENLLYGTLDTSKMKKMTDHVNRVSLLAGCSETQLLPEDVMVIYSTISKHFPKELISSYETPDSEDVYIENETKIRCENAFDLYLEWLKNNGITPDVIQCLKEKKIAEKNKILEELYNFAASSGVSEGEEQIVYEDEQTKKFLRDIFDASFGIFFDTIQNYIDIFPYFSGSKNQKIDPTEMKNRMQAATSVLSSLPADDPNSSNAYFAQANARRLIDSNDFSGVLTKEFGTEFDSAISGGDVFWDYLNAVQKGRLSSIFRHDGQYYYFTLQGDSAPIFSCSCKKQIGDLYYINREFRCDDLVVSDMVENDFIVKNINLYTPIQSFKNYFSRGVIQDIPIAFKEEQYFPFFKTMLENGLYNFIQETFVSFLINYGFSESILLQRYHLGGTETTVYGVDLFLAYFREIVVNESRDGYESLFIPDDWFEKFYSIVKEKLKATGEYSIQDSLHQLSFEMKMRFVAFVFRMATLNIAPISGVLDASFISKYLNTRYKDLNKEFIIHKKRTRVDKEQKNFEMVNSLREQNEDDGSVDVVQKFLDTSIFPKTENTSLSVSQRLLELEEEESSGLYSTSSDYGLDVTIEELRNELQKTTQMFSSSLNSGNPVSVTEAWLRSLRFRHFDGRVMSLEVDRIRQYYNNMETQKEQFDLFLEMFYEDGDGETRNFSLVSGSRVYSKKHNIYVQYNNKPQVSILHFFDEEKIQRIPEFYFSISFAKYKVVPENWFFGREHFDIEFILPIYKIKIKPQDIYDSWSKLNNVFYDDKAKELFVFNYLIKKMEEEDGFKVLFSYVLGFHEISDYYQIFLYEVMRRTTNIDSMMLTEFQTKSNVEGKEKTFEQSKQEIEKYEKDDNLRSDTFGILRRSLASTAIQKMAMSMAEDTPKMIFKAFVEMTDKNIAAARYIVDNNRFGPPESRRKLDIRFVSLVLLQPVNLWPPPGGFGPPITPFGFIYLALEDKLKSKKQKTKETQEEINEVVQSGEETFPEEERTSIDILRNVHVNCYLEKEKEEVKKDVTVDRSCFY